MDLKSKQFLPHQTQAVQKLYHYSYLTKQRLLITSKLSLQLLNRLLLPEVDVLLYLPLTVQVTGFTKNLLKQKLVKINSLLLDFPGQYILKELKPGEKNKIRYSVKEKQPKDVS